MSRNYYVLSNGRVQRESNTLSIINEKGVKKPIPVEDVESLYLYGEVDINTKLLVFLSQKRIALHVFNYYGFYSGSYYPREYLNSGHLLVKQVERYGDAALRLELVKELVRGSAHSILRNVSYYSRRGREEGRGNREQGRGEREEDEPPGEIGGPIPNTGVPTDEFAEAAVDGGLMFEGEMEGGGERETEHTTPMPNTGAELDSPPHLTSPTPTLNPLRGAQGTWGQEPNAQTPNAEHPTPTEDPFVCSVDVEGAAGTPLDQLRRTIEGIVPLIETQPDVNSLRGVEGKIRERYYQSWRHILAEGFYFTQRVRRPPDNEINALISFGNSMLYTVCLSEIYRTQLTPTISYLHEPGARRFSLALDLSEIFKPLIVDRAIFTLVNRGQLKPEHFDRTLEGCYLTEAGKKLYLGELETRLATTIKHRRLGRHVSYRHLIRLECYKLIRDLTGVEPYRAFRAWW